MNRDADDASAAAWVKGCDLSTRRSLPDVDDDEGAAGRFLGRLAPPRIVLVLAALAVVLSALSDIQGRRRRIDRGEGRKTRVAVVVNREDVSRSAGAALAVPQQTTADPPTTTTQVNVSSEAVAAVRTILAPADPPLLTPLPSSMADPGIAHRASFAAYRWDVDAMGPSPHTAPVCRCVCLLRQADAACDATLGTVRSCPAGEETVAATHYLGRSGWQLLTTRHASARQRVSRRQAAHWQEAFRLTQPGRSMCCQMRQAVERVAREGINVSLEIAIVATTTTEASKVGVGGKKFRLSDAALNLRGPDELLMHRGRLRRLRPGTWMLPRDSLESTAAVCLHGALRPRTFPANWRRAVDLVIRGIRPVGITFAMFDSKFEPSGGSSDEGATMNGDDIDALVSLIDREVGASINPSPRPYSHRSPRRGGIRAPPPGGPVPETIVDAVVPDILVLHHVDLVQQLDLSGSEGWFQRAACLAYYRLRLAPLSGSGPTSSFPWRAPDVVLFLRPDMHFLAPIHFSWEPSRREGRTHAAAEFALRVALADETMAATTDLPPITGGPRPTFQSYVINNVTLERDGVLFPTSRPMSTRPAVTDFIMLAANGERLEQTLMSALRWELACFKPPDTSGMRFKEEVLLHAAQAVGKMSVGLFDFAFIVMRDRVAADDLAGVDPRRADPIACSGGPLGGSAAVPTSRSNRCLFMRPDAYRFPLSVLNTTAASNWRLWTPRATADSGVAEPSASGGGGGVGVATVAPSTKAPPPMMRATVMVQPEGAAGQLHRNTPDMGRREGW